MQTKWGTPAKLPILILINMSENTTEREKSVLKTTPSPQGATHFEIFRPSFSFHFMCAYWEYSRKSYLTLNSSQPNRKRPLKIVLTRWVMTAGESKAELSTGYFHNQWKAGVSFIQSRDTLQILTGLDWAAARDTEWLFLTLPWWVQCGDTEAGHSRECPVTLTLQDQCLPLTSPPGRYSNLSCPGKLTIFTNDLSPNLLNVVINVLEINQLNMSKGETAVV